MCQVAISWAGGNMFFQTIPNSTCRPIMIGPTAKDILIAENQDTWIWICSIASNGFGDRKSSGAWDTDWSRIN